MGQGRENARTFLLENHAIRERIDAAIRQKIGLPKPGSVPEAGTDADAAPPKTPAAAAARSVAQTA
jgi:hypothetical protein